MGAVRFSQVHSMKKKYLRMTLADNQLKAYRRVAPETSETNRPDNSPKSVQAEAVGFGVVSIQVVCQARSEPVKASFLDDYLC